MSDELMFFRDAETEPLEVHSSETWKVMIVDDDPEMHAVTKMVLQDFVFAKKHIEFISAYSGAEAIEAIEKNPDTALIFLDVVMEQDDSGLKVVKHIREVLNNFFVRIILRTGEPGQAPEEKVIANYDINDYKEKTELTSRKLFTTTMASLRSYRDLRRIDHTRKGLEQIIDSSNDIGKFRSMREFISGVLLQLTSILGMEKNAFYSQSPCFIASKEQDDFYVLSAIGDYAEYLDQSVHSIRKQSVLAAVDEAIQSHTSIYEDDHITLYFKTKTQSEHIIYLENNEKLDAFDIELISVFIANVAIAYDNIFLNKENEDTQREIIFGLGEITEARSKEVGQHVKRVAEYCRLLAKEVGLSEEEAECIYIASTMHDVGKVAIPDSILNKPDKLTPEEFEIIKLHTSMGYEMLRKSHRPIMQMAAIIASQHHEKYDGSGYPSKLKGEAIHIAGRIAAVADVFDALGTKRVYKTAWELQEILLYMKKERNTHFDPQLIDILFDHVDDFIRIRTEFAD